MPKLKLLSTALSLLTVMLAPRADAALPQDALYTSTRDAIHFHGADLTVAKVPRTFTEVTSAVGGFGDYDHCQH
jgi:hypothetical protein